MLGKAEPINSCESGRGRMEEKETGEVKADVGLQPGTPILEAKTPRGVSHGLTR